ncbi:MAG: cadmium-translocating P-type ATPase [Armatimonadetes bacterium]|nr:cadmium-translocating P-type ATPase [Armatimonadota bacterium]
MPESTFTIEAMDCPTEEQIIRNCFKVVKEVENLEFDLMSRKLTVRHCFADDKPLLKALKSVGMEPKAKGADKQEHGPAVPVKERWLMGISGALAFGAEIASWVTGKETSSPVIAAAVLSIVLGGRTTIRKGIVSLKTFTLNINFLMTLAIIGAVSIGEWPEAAMVTFLFGVAEMTEAFSLDRARHAIRSLMELSPELAWVKSGSEWKEVQASEVQVGQVVRVRPGERIPLDGLVVSGSSTVNEAPITGESMPVSKSEGAKVFAGTVNEKGSFEFEVSANTDQTTLARIIRAVQQAQGQKAPTQRFVDQFAKVYTPTVVVLAILVAALPSLLFSQPFVPWLYKSLVLLVIACPCALVISTPVTVVSALASAARRGILVKGGIYMEEGRKLTTIALDKTGTITFGKPKVTDIEPLNSVPKDEVLRIAASLEALSEHPVASAIIAAFEAEPARVEGFDSITGRGVKGTVGGKMYFLGNHRLAHEENYCSPEVEAKLERLEEQGKTVVILGDSDRALGVLAVADTERETSIEAIRELHRLGVKTLMLTGDNSRTAKAIAAQVGIDDARGDLLPEDKLRIIEELAKEGRHVGMVGDGINDAPALAKANIGFAMGAAGTDTAIETADVALMHDDLRKVPEFIRLSRKASRVLRQNIAIALGIKVVFFGLAFFGVATLWMAVFADMGASLIVVGNGLRLLRTPNGS